MESNYYQEYEYISFFAPESESNHPLGEMVTSPRGTIAYIGLGEIDWGNSDLTAISIGAGIRGELLLT